MSAKMSKRLIFLVLFFATAVELPLLSVVLGKQRNVQHKAQRPKTQRPTAHKAQRMSRPAVIPPKARFAQAGRAMMAARQFRPFPAQVQPQSSWLGRARAFLPSAPAMPSRATALGVTAGIARTGADVLKQGTMAYVNPLMGALGIGGAPVSQAPSKPLTVAQKIAAGQRARKQARGALGRWGGDASSEASLAQYRAGQQAGHVEVSPETAKEIVGGAAAFAMGNPMPLAKSVGVRAADAAAGYALDRVVPQQYQDVARSAWSGMKQAYEGDVGGLMETAADVSQQTGYGQRVFGSKAYQLAQQGHGIAQGWQEGKYSAVAGGLGQVSEGYAPEAVSTGLQKVGQVFEFGESGSELMGGEE